MFNSNIKYAPETCELCDGKGIHTGICPACGGQGSVLVAQPARHCALCGGTGFYNVHPCPACGGTSWAHSLKNDVPHSKDVKHLIF